MIPGVQCVFVSLLFALLLLKSSSLLLPIVGVAVHSLVSSWI